MIVKKNIQAGIIFLILTLSNVCMAQEDKSVKEKNIPSEVKKYIEEKYPGATHLNYNKEIIGDTTFYEPSFIFKKDRYTILLFPDGRIYETEILIKYDELPSEIKSKITEDLQKRYLKYTVITTEEVNPDGVLKYEIKVRAKKDKHQGYFEVYYDKEGNFINEEEEIIKSIPSNSGF